MVATQGIVEESLAITSTSNQNKLNPYTPPADALDLCPNQDKGILKEIKTVGKGTQKPGKQDRVQVHYFGYFPEDGTVFDTSRDRREKFEFTLGRGNVIKAWDIGVASMLQGEVAILYCKPEYAYGEKGHPPKIPPNATLVFEIELFDWKGEDLTEEHDGGIIRDQVTEGTGYSSPKEGASVDVHLTGKYNEQVFDDRDVTFVLGEGADKGVPAGVEKGLEKFLKNEKSVLKLSPQYAFGADGKPEWNVPANAEVTYEVTLNNFEKMKESWELDTKERVEQSNIFKQNGTEFFKAEKYRSASKQYQKIVSYLEHETNVADKDLQQECTDLLLAAHLNLALCHLKLEDFIKARYSCEKALDIDPNSEKGLFRRGQAFLAMNDYDLALKDFNGVLAIDHDNKAAAAQIVKCNNMIREQKRKDKCTYGNMFAKFAAQDEMRERRLRNADNVLANPGTWPAKQQQVSMQDSGVPNIPPEVEMVDMGQLNGLATTSSP